MYKKIISFLTPLFFCSSIFASGTVNNPILYRMTASVNHFYHHWSDLIFYSSDAEIYTPYSSKDECPITVNIAPNTTAVITLAVAEFGGATLCKFSLTNNKDGSFSASVIPSGAYICKLSGDPNQNLLLTVKS